MPWLEGATNSVYDLLRIGDSLLSSERNDHPYGRIDSIEVVLKWHPREQRRATVHPSHPEEVLVQCARPEVEITLADHGEALCNRGPQLPLGGPPT